MSAEKVVYLRGEIDVYSARKACRELDGIDGPTTIDLSEVSLLCAAGLTELARLAARAGRRVVTLRAAPPHVLRVLKIAKFDELFVIEP